MAPADLVDAREQAGGGKRSSIDPGGVAALELEGDLVGPVRGALGGHGQEEHVLAGRLPRIFEDAARQWDDLADNSVASRRAEDVEDEARRLLQRIQDRDECNRIKAKFNDVRVDFGRLSDAVLEDDELSGNQAVLRQLGKLNQRVRAVEALLD